MFNRIPLVVVTALALAPALAPGTTSGADWSRFRGPNGTGVAQSANLPLEFGPETAVEWVSDVPAGRSSPVLTANRLFLTAIDEDRLVTLSIDRATGEIVWRQELEREFTADMYHGTDSASSTPVTDGSNVFVFFHEAGLVSYDADGIRRWQKSLGSFRNFYGVAASPILVGNTLLLTCDQADGSFLLAIDKDSGEELWRRQRPGRIESYATPLLLPSAEAPTAVLVLGSRWIDAYDTATGNLLWSLPGVGVGPVSSPTMEGDRLFVTAPDQASEPLPVFATLLAEHDANGDGQLVREELDGTWMFNHFGFLELGGDGILTADDWANLGDEMTTDHWGVFGVRLRGAGEAPEILWNVRQSVPYIPTPLAYDNVLYLVKKGIVSALDPATGELYKRGRLAKAAEVNASPVAAGGRIYIATADGKIAVLKAGPDWEILAMNDLGDPIDATPAIADDHLYVRTRSRLFSFAADGAPPPAVGARP